MVDVIQRVIGIVLRFLISPNEYENKLPHKEELDCALTIIVRAYAYSGNYKEVFDIFSAANQAVENYRGNKFIRYIHGGTLKASYLRYHGWIISVIQGNPEKGATRVQVYIENPDGTKVAHGRVFESDGNWTIRYFCQL
jgi:hypothetical protein